MKTKIFLILIVLCLLLIFACNTTSNSESKNIISGNVILLAPKIKETGQIADTMRFSYSVNNLKIYLFDANNNKEILIDSTFTSCGKFYFKNINKSKFYNLYARISDGFYYRIAEINNPITSSDTIFLDDCLIEGFGLILREELKCFPNPFYNSFDIQFTIDSTMLIKIQINNISGELINKFIDEEIIKYGTYLYQCNLNIEPAIYFLTIRKGNVNLFNIIHRPEI